MPPCSLLEVALSPAGPERDPRRLPFALGQQAVAHLGGVLLGDWEENLAKRSQPTLRVVRFERLRICVLPRSQFSVLSSTGEGRRRESLIRP